MGRGVRDMLLPLRRAMRIEDCHGHTMVHADDTGSSALNWQRRTTRLRAAPSGENVGTLDVQASLLSGMRHAVVSDAAGRAVARLSRPAGMGSGVFAVPWRVDVLDPAAQAAQLLVLASLIWREQVPLGEKDACNCYFYDTLEFVVLPLVALALAAAGCVRVSSLWPLRCVMSGSRREIQFSPLQLV